MGPRGFVGYRGYNGIRGATGNKGDKGENGDVNVPYQIILKKYCFHLPLNKSAIDLNKDYIEIYFGNGLSESLEKDDKFMNLNNVMKDPKNKRRYRMYAIYSDNSNKKTSRSLEVEISPCGVNKFINNQNQCKFYKFNLPLKGTLDFETDTYDGFSDWIDDYHLDPNYLNKTTVRVKISEPKDNDLNKDEIKGKLYYLEFQVCDFYQTLDFPNLNKFRI